jgi:hypothetical protein
LQEQKRAEKSHADAANPSPLQEQKLPRDPLIVGIIAKLAGGTLRGQIERTYSDLLTVGREILEKEKRACEAAAAHGRVSVQGRDGDRASRNGR